MIQGLNVLLTSMVALWLAACGGGGGAKEEAAASDGVTSTTDATGEVATATGTAKPSGPVTKGENSQVEVKTDNGTTPSLTLSRLGSNKLTWNEVVKAGANYLVYERTDTTTYDFNTPMQSLEDVISLVLSEKPGTHCYIIRAKTKDGKISVDSNEICIVSTTPTPTPTATPTATATPTPTPTVTPTPSVPALNFDRINAVDLIATQTVNFTLRAAAGDTAATYSCTARCPDGLTLDHNSGHVNWIPRLDQAGEHKVTFKAEAAGQSLEQEATITVREAFINLTLSTEGQAIGEEQLTVKAVAQSNLSGTPSLSIAQTSGPAVSLSGSAGTWSFQTPNVRHSTDFSFEVTAALSGVTRKATASLTVLAKDHGPTLQAYADRHVVATETLSVSSSASDPDNDTLSFACVLNCPLGLNIDAATGAITWQPGLDQVGDAHPTIRVTANGQSVSTTLNIQVQAPSLQMNLTALTAVTGETVSIQPNVQSNLQGPYQWILTQTAGPSVSVSGSNGNWSFAAPAVDERQTLSFALKAGNGRFTTEQTLSVQIDPIPVAPSIDVGGNRVTRLPIDVSATVSSNGKTLAWSSLSGPGHVTFSAATAATTRISADTDGVYLIQLAATNSTGQTGTATFQLTWDTSAPQISAGADVSTAMALTRTATVQGAKTLAWSKVSGPGSLVFSSSNAATTTITADQDGDYEIQLYAEDEAGNSASSRFIWHYDHTPPTVTLADAIVMQVKTKALVATVSDDAVAIKWKKVSGPSTLTFAPDNARNTTITLGGDGVYVVEVSAADALGNTATAQQQVTVDTLPPQITSVALGSVVSDGFLNTFEKAQTLPLINTVTVNESSAYTLGYKIVSSSTSCTSSLTYASTIPLSNDATISKAGTWRVCVKATDSINLSAYAASPNFVYDTTVVAVTLTSLPINPSRTTQLSAIVGGKSITHYKSKVGPADSTNCSSISSYSSEAAIATPITTDYAELTDGTLRLCVIGRLSTGNWQDLSNAYKYEWVLDRVVPEDPASLTITPLVSRVRFNWDAARSADSYLIVRSEDKAVTWVPSSGSTYNVGDDIDGGTHSIVAVSNTLQGFDETAVGGKEYYYGLFAFDKALNYAVTPARGKATALETVGFNKANGFDRLVRTIVPIREGEHKGKILVGGDFLVYQKDAAVRLMRLNADYTLDTTFKAAAINSSVYSIALADDGSIYIGGSFTTVGGKPRVRIARLSSNGALDEAFTPSGFNNTVMSLALSNDQNRLYVGGSFTAISSTPAVTQNRLAALRTVDGAQDTAFVQKQSPDGALVGFNNTVWTILPDPNSSEIYVGGAFTSYGNTVLARLVKLDDTGEIDINNFSLGSGFNSTVVTVKMDSRQRLYVGGSFSSYRGSSYYARLVRLKADGAPDTDFNKGVSTAQRLNSTVYGIALDETNNRVYASGDFTLYGTATATRLIRLSMADGSQDTGYTSGANASLQALTLAENGDLLGGGSFSRFAGESTPYFFAAGANGVLSDKSPRGSVFNSNVFAAQKVGDQTILAGSFTTYNGDVASRVARLDRQGNLDKTFTSQVTNGSVYAIAWDDADKKLYIGGTFTQVNAVARNRIARLNADGTLDTSFVPEGVDSDVYALAVATMPGTHAKVVYVGGKFANVGTTATGRIVRLLADGKTDGSFQSAIGTGFDSNVNALAVVSSGDDHSVFVGGAFTKFNSTVANAYRIVKLSSDGLVASGFEPGAGFNSTVQALLWVPGEGALYVGGAFSRYQTTIVMNKIAKLDATGGVSANFSGTGFNSTVYALDYDSDNDLIWAGGAFTTFRSIAQGRIAAMGRDGSRIAAMNAPVGFNSDVRALSSSFLGVIAAGLGSSYETDICGFAARLHVNATMD